MMKNPIGFVFVMSVVMVDLSFGRPSTMRTPEEIKKFAEFLKAKSHGKPEGKCDNYRIIEVFITFICQISRFHEVRSKI